MRQYAFPVTIFLLVVAIVGLISWVSINKADSSPTNPNIVSVKGIHSHPQLEVYAKGQKIEIPQNIGVGSAYAGRPGYGQGGMAMTPTHTHDDVPVIHHEFEGLVTRDDLKLKNFFAVWGKEFMSFGETVSMTVNGQPNTELENYEMKDGDKIILRYE